MKVKEKIAKAFNKTKKYLIAAFFVLAFTAGVSSGNFLISKTRTHFGKYSYHKNKSVITDSLFNKLCEFEEKEQRIEAMSKTMKVAYSVSDWEAKYYSIIFDDFSKKYGVPWQVYPAVMRIESNFRTTLKSGKGARGLMQVMDGTAKEISEKIGINYNSETLWNDLLNLVIGMTYLTEGILSEVDSSEVGEKDIRHGFQIYLGGPDYKKTIQSNEANETYLIRYRSTAWDEYHKLVYIYKGVVSEQDPCCG